MSNSINSKNYFGLKILNYEAGSIYSYNLGIRKNYNTNDSILANSLFSDYLLTIGLKRYKLQRFSVEKNDKTIKVQKWISDKEGDWTRDIICIDFKSGVDYLNELKKSLNNLEKAFESGKIEQKKFQEKEKQLKEKIEKEENHEKTQNAREIKHAKENTEKYETKSKTVKEIRIEFYVNGITIAYSDKEIKYKMLYRSAGKAKSGSCMFIREGLYKKAREFLRMGKTFINEDSKIVEIGSYQSLVASAINGKVKINPANILVISDIADESSFKRSVVRVFQDKNQKLTTDNKLTEKLKNNLFDGQSLIDSSIFKKSEFYDEKEKLNGYILLRQHFFKSAAFCTDIKQFFQDFCKKYHHDYENFTVEDVWHNKHYVKDIELITTPSSMKWMKFGKENSDYEYWCKKVSENENIFGICKTAHESKLGEYQRMSYQFVNSIDYTQEIAACSIEYVEKLNANLDEYIKDKSKKLEDNEFIKFLKQKSTFSNDYEVLAELCKRNRNFMKTKYFRDRRKAIISAYKNEIKSGKLIQEAENLVIVGSPYAMLLHAAGKDIYKEDDMFIKRKGSYSPIQCYTERFSDGEELAEFRSPFNGRNNMGYLINNYPPENVRKYFKEFGKQIIAVNMVGNDFQCRNSGSDQDSDFIYCTNQKQIVECASKYYKDYETIINDVAESTGNKDDSELLKKYNKKDYLDVKYALKDYILSNAQMAIGESSNLAQLCLTYSYSNPDKKKYYEKYVVLLSVIAQIAIDNAKRQYCIDPKSEIEIIRKNMDIEENKYPLFWEIVEQRSKNKNNDKKEKNQELKCPMNSIYKLKLKDGHEDSSELPTIDMKELYVKHHDSSVDRKKIMKIQEIISEYEKKLRKANFSEDDEEKENVFLLLQSDFKEMLEEIKKNNIDTLTLSSILLDRAFCITREYPESTIRGINKNKALLLNMLYNLDYNNDEKKVLDCFRAE